MFVFHYSIVTMMQEFINALLLLLLQDETQSFSVEQLQHRLHPLYHRNRHRHRHTPFRYVHVTRLEAGPAGSDSSIIQEETNAVKEQQFMHVPTLSINDDQGVLASLFGSPECRDEFFLNKIGREVAYYPRSRSQTQPPPLVGINLLSLYETNEWISLRKRGSRDLIDKTQMSYDGLVQYIATGGSAVIPIRPGDYMYAFKAQNEQSLGVADTSMNIYHSGPSAVALNVHYDSYDVFVLQLEGHKEWMIQNDAFSQPMNEITEWRNVTMTEGDLLYIPKGVFHAATTAAGYDTTTHVTIGF